MLHRDHRDDETAAHRAPAHSARARRRARRLARARVAERCEPGGPAAPLLDVAAPALRCRSAAISTSLVGAADVASQLGDREQALTILSAGARPRDRRVARHRRRSASARSVDAVAKWAIDALVDLYRTGGRAARRRRHAGRGGAPAVRRQNTRRELRLRAAQLATVELGDNAAAIDMYRSVLAQSPNDLEVIERLAHLLDARGPRPRAAHAAPDPARPRDRPDKKLELRLELARLVGIVEERGGRLDALKANLEDQPGHEASIDAVAALLVEQGPAPRARRSARGAGQRLETAGDAGARGQAVGALRARRRERHPARSSARSPVTAASSRSRRPRTRSAPSPACNLERSQPGQAVPWLESLLGTVPPPSACSSSTQLAQAHLSAKQHRPRDRRDRGRTSTTRSRRSSCARCSPSCIARPSSGSRWRATSRAACRCSRTRSVAREFAREASTIYTDKLDAPAKAIPALETALALDPTDKDLRAALAIGQRVAGKLRRGARRARPS